MHTWSLSLKAPATAPVGRTVFGRVSRADASGLGRCRDIQVRYERRESYDRRESYGGRDDAWNDDRGDRRDRPRGGRGYGGRGGGRYDRQQAVQEREPVPLTEAEQQWVHINDVSRKCVPLSSAMFPVSSARPAHSGASLAPRRTAMRHFQVSIQTGAQY